MIGSAHVIRGDALHLPLPDGSVDLVVTSPPYFALRSYQDGGVHYPGQVGSEATPAAFVDALLAATVEMVRVLKPSGSIWINLGDKYAGSGGGGAGSSDGETGRGPRPARFNVGIPTKSLMGIPWRYALRCIDELGLILRAEVIWSKPNGLPESVTDRVRRAHEQWFHFTKLPRYFSAVDEIREAHVRSWGGAANGGHTYGAMAEPGAKDANLPYALPNPLGKLPGSVWTVPTQPLTVPPQLGVDHRAAFPTEWPRRIIQGWAPAPGVVLDPFGGTGTSALAAKVLGRTGITVDLSGDYCRLARWRTTDPDQVAGAARVAKPPREVVGQEAFDFEGR